MLTAMGTIGALDVDAVPPSLIGPGAAPALWERFYLQDTSRDRLPAFFAAARERGLTTSFDTNWDPTERWDGGVLEMLRASDVFFPNAAEARRIAGSTTSRRPPRRSRRSGADGTDRWRADRRRSSWAPPAPSRSRPAVRSSASRRCRSTRSTRPARATPSTPASCGPGSTAATFAESLELGVACGALSTRAARRRRRPADARRGACRAGGPMSGPAAGASRRPRGCCSSRRTRRSTGSTRSSG